MIGAAMAEDHEARGQIRELKVEVESLGELWKTTFEGFRTSYDKQLANGMGVVIQNDTRVNTLLTAMEQRLNTKISESEGRQLGAIAELKSMFTSISQSYSTKGWDFLSRVVFGVSAFACAILLAYIALIGKHP